MSISCPHIDLKNILIYFTKNNCILDPSTLVGNDTAADELVSTLHILEVTAAFIHKDLLPKVSNS